MDDADTAALMFFASLTGLCVLGIIAENVWRDIKIDRLKRQGPKVRLALRTPRDERLIK